MVFNDCIDSFRDIPSIIKHTSNYYPQSNNCKKKKKIVQLNQYKNQLMMAPGIKIMFAKMIYYHILFCDYCRIRNGFTIKT